MFDRVVASGDAGVPLFAGPAALAALAAAPWGDALSPAEVQALQRWSAQLRALRAANAAPAAPQPPAASHDAASLLSSREREVLARIAAGDSNKLIARAFDLSPHTVKRHVANILDKLGVQSRGQAAAWYRAAS
jgi:LuxR family maltose regulon positive regulatory protein